MSKRSVSRLQESHSTLALQSRICTNRRLNLPKLWAKTPWSSRESKRLLLQRRRAAKSSRANLSKKTEREIKRLQRRRTKSCRSRRTQILKRMQQRRNNLKTKGPSRIWSKLSSSSRSPRRLKTPVSERESLIDHFL
jgi:hypothetical protein